MNKEVSIIITNFNYNSYLSRCIRSCLSQSLASEVILVDDCSQDDPRDQIEPYLDNIVFCKTEKNLGISGASNLGIMKAQGRFVVRVDADDYVNENFSLFLSEYLKANKQCIGVSCDYYLVDESEEKIENKSAEDFPISCGIMYRKDILERNGLYNIEYRHREEEELRKRMGGKYKVDHLKIPLYRYRMHETNKTKTQEYKDCKV